MRKPVFDQMQFDFDAIESAFTPTTATEDQKMKYSDINEMAKVLGKLIIRHCPDTGDRCTAIERLREAAMWANSSIAHFKS